MCVKYDLRDPARSSEQDLVTHSLEQVKGKSNTLHAVVRFMTDLFSKDKRLSTASRAKNDVKKNVSSYSVLHLSELVRLQTVF